MADGWVWGAGASVLSGIIGLLTYVSYRWRTRKVRAAQEWVIGQRLREMDEARDAGRESAPTPGIPRQSLYVAGAEGGRLAARLEAQRSTLAGGIPVVDRDRD